MELIIVASIMAISVGGLIMCDEIQSYFDNLPLYENEGRTNLYDSSL